MLRLFQVYLPSIDSVAVIDFWNLTPEKFEWFNVLLKVVSDKKVIKFCQRGIFDFLWIFWKFRFLPRNVIDTFLLSQIEKAGQIEGFLFDVGIQRPNSLENLAEEHGFVHDKSLQSSDWSNPILSQDQINYACRDAKITYLIGQTLYEELSEAYPLVVDAECSSIGGFVWMTYNGIPCDVNVLNKLLRSYYDKANSEAQRLSKLMPFDPIYHKKVLEREEELKQLKMSGTKTRKAPFKDKPFNVASPAQILVYLKRCGYDEELKKIDKSSGEMKDSTGKEILFKLSSDHPEHKELREIVLFRGVNYAASKLKSYRESYDPFRQCIDTTYNILASQGMGRSSSSEKGKSDKGKKTQNCQNVSNYLTSHEHFGLKPIRSICRPKEGYVLAEIDLDASHSQFARQLSGDESLTRSKREGIKLHYFTLSAMFKMQGINHTPEDCIKLVAGELDPGNHVMYKRLYKLSKNVFYSFLNCSGAATLQQTFFKEEMLISLEDCKFYLDACALSFHQLREFQNQVYNDALKTQMKVQSRLGESLGTFIYTRPCDGSILYYRGFRQQNRFNGRWEYKWKISDIVSGLWLRPEATVMKKAIGQITDFHLDNPDLDFRMVNFSHDSVMLEIKKEHIEGVLPYCFDIVKNSMRRFIPDYEPEDPWQDTIKLESWAK
jgi:DNA polymerase I-like protein with 3'-5' exonuclease and polymerase domains